MQDINRINITGNVTREPELTASQSGTQILSFGIASNDSRFDKRENKWVDIPNFVNCVMFGSRAEGLSRILHKGQKVAIEGKLHYSQWEKDGHKRSKLEIYVDSVVLMSKPEQVKPERTDPMASVYDDDCPF